MEAHFALHGAAGFAALILAFASGVLLGLHESPFSRVELPDYLVWVLVLCLIGSLGLACALLGR